MFPQIIKEIGSELIKNFPQIVENGKQLLKSLIDGAKSFFSNLGQMAKDIISNIVNGLKELPSKMLDIGKNIVEGMINGIKNMASKAVDAVKNLGKSLVNGVKKTLGIASPSKVFKQLGEFTAEGYIEGYTDEMKNATSEMQDAMPTSFNTNASLTASGLPAGSLASTGGYATASLVEAFKTAMEGMRIEMGEDGFASFVVDTITNEIYQ